MNSLLTTFALFVILNLAHSFAEEPASVDNTPKEKPIVQTMTEDGEEEVWGIESTRRQELLYPSLWGSAGIFRVRSAESLPEGALAFGVGGEFYTVGNAPNMGAGNLSASTIAEDLFVGYAPTRNLTLSLMRRNSSTTFGNPQQLISSLGDLNFQGLYSFPINDSFAVAPIANILIASNFNNLAPAGSTLSAGLGLAVTYGLWPSLGVPFFIHANLLYHMPQIRTTKFTPAIEPESYFNFSRYHTVTLALGAEYKVGDFIPFLEYDQVTQTNSNIGFVNSPSKITIGTRVTPISNKSLSFLGGVDIGLVKNRLNAGIPFSPDYQIIGQICYTVGLSSTERKHYYTTSDIHVVDRKFVIRKNINFKIAAAELERDSVPVLSEIARVIQENKIRKLLIVGHTDSSHTEDYNLKLSIDRANAVKRYLVAQGIPDEALMAQGYGKRRPKASNLTDSGRAVNRRVEFYILD